MDAAHRIFGLFVLALAAAPSSSMQAPAAPAEVRARMLAGTQCRAPELVLYSCRFGRAVGSVCASGGTIRYRYGPPGDPEIEIVSASDWSNIFVGAVTGQMGGHQSHVRFARGDHHYILFEGVDGAAARNPGREYSGIHVASGADGARQLAHLECRGRPILLGDFTSVLADHAPPAVRDRGVQVETPGGPFDAWF